MNYEEDQVTEADYKDRNYTQHYVTSNANPSVEFIHPQRWANIPEKEKWKYTLGVMLRAGAITLGLWVLFFLLLVVAV